MTESWALGFPVGRDVLGSKAGPGHYLLEGGAQRPRKPLATRRLVFWEGGINRRRSLGECSKYSVLE